MFSQIKFFIFTFSTGIIITLLLGFGMYFIIDKEKERILKCDEYIIKINQLEQENKTLKNELRKYDEIY